MRRRWSVLGVAACVLVAAGCTSEPEEAATEEAATERAAEGEGWTVLVYSIADTDLEPYLLADLAEFAEVGSNENLQVAAMVDRAEDYSSDPMLGIDDWVGAKYVSIGQGSAEELEELGDVDTGDPAPLAEFIAQGIADHPAEKYALVISNHGAAWPGVGGDEGSDHSVLSLEELRGGISDGLEQAGLDKLDLLGFDACLMATYETASMMAPLADRMIASQELEPGHGWDYRAFQVAADDPAVDVDTLGKSIIDGFAAQAQAQGTGADITLSMVDLNRMGDVDAAVADFSDALSERAADVAPVVGRERAEVLSFGRDPDPTVDTHMADLGLLAAQIGVDALDVSDQADALIRAINDAVPYKVAGPAAQGASGLSIYFPPTEDLLNADYASVESAQAWGGFLSSYFEAGSAIPEDRKPSFETADGEVESYFDDYGLNLEAVFDAAAEDNVVWSSISYGEVGEDGSVTFFGEEQAEVSDDGSGTVLGSYDLTAMTISDGVDTSYAYLTVTWGDEDAGSATIDVPLAYYAPGEDEEYRDVTLTIAFDPESGDVLNETYYANTEAGTYGELTTDPEGIIVPKLLVVAPDGTESWEPATDVGLFADLPNLQYGFEPLESGTPLYAQLTVTDFGGNSDSVSTEVVVP
ncbi:clostripain-related cysteine peptidase [Blastococcus goldschmidtiae]|uniref:Clostripain-related cysteine peptidase n=1 Tax=Blastococcus goldschmidtiae TaxID=3075546 RepID=A0ABU2KB84_9ACTN|nr:clostripain-related cysteine peptidase [Blastococcus sp. DSM 46792]MDT0277449.1 clostripain-related cysteine peptidase [Blastococcus sp. DSM 46792]